MHNMAWAQHPHGMQVGCSACGDYRERSPVNAKATHSIARTSSPSIIGADALLASQQCLFRSPCHSSGARRLRSASSTRMASVDTGSTARTATHTACCASRRKLECVRTWRVAQCALAQLTCKQELERANTIIGRPLTRQRVCRSPPYRAWLALRTCCHLRDPSCPRLLNCRHTPSLAPLLGAILCHCAMCSACRVPWSRLAAAQEPSQNGSRHQRQPTSHVATMYTLLSVLRSQLRPSHTPPEASGLPPGVSVPNGPGSALLPPDPNALAQRTPRRHPWRALSSCACA